MCKTRATFVYDLRNIEQMAVVCVISGKPITVSNKRGTFCEDMCDFNELQEQYDKAMRLMKEKFGE
jgi:hypothetical protein